MVEVTSRDRRIRVYDGTLIDPFDPQPHHMRAENFIHQSSIVNRYAGGTKYPYSIGQHSYVLSLHVPKRLRRAALIHDWAETWFQDMPSPIKQEFPDYKAAEHEAMLKIGNKFGVGRYEFEDLDPYDKAIYIDERNSMMTNHGDFSMGDDLIGLDVNPRYFKETRWDMQKAITATQFRILFNGS